LYDAVSIKYKGYRHYCFRAVRLEIGAQAHHNGNIYGETKSEISLTHINND